MKKLLLLVALVTTSLHYASAQCSPLIFDPNNSNHTDLNSQLNLDIKADFCATGNGTTDDHDAFRAAAAFINARTGYAGLYIPPGTYRVGRQNAVTVAPDFVQQKGEDVFPLSQSNQVKIYGDDKATTLLKFNDGLRYGSFDENNSPVDYPGGVGTPDARYGSDLKTVFNFDRCDNISLENLSLDGNFYAGKVTIGGKYSEQGYQISHTGIFVKASSLTANNIVSKRFGLDGITVVNNGYDPASKLVALADCLFETNGRQGLSWVGGDGLTATNCFFNSTGKGIISSSPGAGIDIEPEPHFGGAPNRCINGTFRDCVLSNNTGAGLVADGNPSSPNSQSYGAELNFYNTTFIGISNWAAWPKRRDMDFYNCTFYGGVVHNYPSDDPDMATYYEDCLFTDCLVGELYGQDIIYPLYSFDPDGYHYSIISDRSRNVIYQDCTFEMYKSTVRIRSQVDNIKWYLNNCDYITSRNNFDYIQLENVVTINSRRYSYGNYCSWDKNHGNDLTGFEPIVWTESNPAPLCVVTNDFCASWEASTDILYQFSNVIQAAEYQVDIRSANGGNWINGNDFASPPVASPDGTYWTVFQEDADAALAYLGPIDVRVRGLVDGEVVSLSNEITLASTDNCFAGTCEAMEIDYFWYPNTDNLVVLWSRLEDNGGSYTSQKREDGASPWSAEEGVVKGQSGEFDVVVFVNVKAEVESLGSLDLRLNAYCPDDFKMTSNAITVTPPQAGARQGNPSISLDFASIPLNDLLGKQKETPSDMGLLLYPNPTTGTLNIAYDGNRDALLEIMDNSGKLIWKQAGVGETLDLNQLANGMYFIRINDGNEVVTEKFTVLR